MACESIGSGLHLLEWGNEINWSPGTYRPANYTIEDYVDEWNEKTDIITSAVEKACPDYSSGYMAPSFIITDLFHSNWTVEKLFDLGYDQEGSIRELGMHK